MWVRRKNAIFRMGFLKRPRLEQAWFLQCWTQPCGCYLMVHLVAEVVVAFGAIAPVRTHQTVIPESIGDALAQVAHSFAGKNWCPEPSEDRRSVEHRVYMIPCVWRRQSVKP